MQPSSPPARPVNDFLQVRRILQRHRPFFVFAALGLAALYAEEAWAANLFWGRLSPANAWLTGMVIVFIVAAGNALAFMLPPFIVRPADFPRPVGAFAMATVLGIALSAVTAGLALLVLLRLTAFNLDAAYILLKDVYVFGMVAVLFQGLLYYVRHMHWLYDNFGGADSPFKPIAASVGVGAVLFVLVVVFLPLDWNGVAAAPAALRGITGLHLYGRDLYLLTLVLAGYGWHLRWIADH